MERPVEATQPVRVHGVQIVILPIIWICSRRQCHVISTEHLWLKSKMRSGFVKQGQVIIYAPPSNAHVVKVRTLEASPWFLVGLKMMHLNAAVVHEYNWMLSGLIPLPP